MCRPVALLTPCGKIMHLSSVEQQHQRLLQRADDVQQARCIDGRTVHETLARHHLDTTCSHLGEKHVRDRRRQRRGVTAIREVQDRTVLGDDGVDEVQVASDPAQFAQDSSRDEQHRDAARPGVRNGSADGWIESIALGNRAVVVECNDRSFTRSFESVGVQPRIDRIDPSTSARHADSMTHEGCGKLCLGLR